MSDLDDHGMEFDITLNAKTTDEGGLVGSFEAQLAEFGPATITLVSQVTPYKVEQAGGFHFEAQRTYHVII